MGLLASIKNFFCDLFGIETKEDRQKLAAEEQSYPEYGMEEDPTSDEEKQEKEHQWEEVNKQLEFVCQSGKAQCTFCNPPMSDLIVTSNTVRLQDKPFMTVKDKDGKVNFNFTGVCLHPSQQKPGAPPPPCKSIISLGEWKDYSETMINDDNALIGKSTIPCMISGQDITIIDSGQKAEQGEVKPKIKREPKVTKLYWMNEEEEKAIEFVEKGQKAVLCVETEDFKPNQPVTIPLKDMKTGEEYKLKGRLDSFGKARISWRGGPCPSGDDYYYEEDSSGKSTEGDKEISEDKPGYYYQEDGVFLGKIGNSENVYITDKGTYATIEKKEKVDESKVIAFTQKYKFNNKQLLDRAHWCYGEGGGLYSDYYAFAIINLKEHGVWGPAKKPYATDEAMYKTKMTHQVTQIKDGKKIKVIKNMYPGYFTGTDGNVNSKAFAEKRKNVKDLNSLIRANQTIKSVIASIMGTIADPTNGAYQWVGGEGSGGGIYKYPDKNNATDVVNVTAQGRYHTFYKLKKE